MLPKKRRLTTAVFDQVFKNGNVIHGNLFLVRWSFQPTTQQPTLSKFAVIVSKKLVPTAVARNSIKRKVYQLLQKAMPADHTGMEFIVGVKKDIRDVSIMVLEVDLSTLLKKILK